MATFIVPAESFDKFIFASQVSIAAADMRAKTDGDGANKLVDGKVQWRTG